MRILITGASGFLGRAVCKLARHQNHEVIALEGKNDCDLTQEHEVREQMARCWPEAILHLAGNPNTRLEVWDRHGLDLLDVNLLGTWHLLRHAPPGCRFLLASSAAVYGDQGLGKVCAQEDTFCLPTSVYGVSKVAAEKLVLEYTRADRVRGTCCRLVAQVGPGATHGLLADVVHKLREEPVLNLLGEPPGSTKPYLHVHTTAQWLLGILPFQMEGADLSPGDGLSVERVAYLAMEELGINKPIHWLGEGANWRGDNRVVQVGMDRTIFPRDLFLPSSEQAVRQALRDMIKEQACTSS